MTESKPPQLLQELYDDLSVVPTVELDDLSTIENWWVSDLKEPEVDLYHRNGAWHLVVEFVLERDGQYHDYSFKLYTNDGEDCIRSNYASHEIVCNTDEDYMKLRELLPGVWTYDGCGWGC